MKCEFCFHIKKEKRIEAGNYRYYGYILPAKRRKAFIINIIYLRRMWS